MHLRVLSVLSALLLSLVALPARADGSVLLVSSDERASIWLGAVSGMLAQDGVTVRLRPAPAARSPLERAAMAQRIARNVGANVALWIEPDPGGGRLRAVATEGERIVEARFLDDDLSASAFAAATVGLVLDAMRPAATHSALSSTTIEVKCACMPPWVPPAPRPTGRKPQP